MKDSENTALARERFIKFVSAAKVLDRWIKLVFPLLETGPEQDCGENVLLVGNVTTLHH